MAETALRCNIPATVEVISPLHVGSGSGRLLADYDFALERGTVWVIDQAKLLERFTDEELRHGTPEVRLSRRLRPGEHEACAAYSLPAGSGVGSEILPCIKDVEGRPYLPGSSLKGALRTVAAWHAAGEMGVPRGDELGPNPKYAASRWEKRVFGRDPNHDLMRALLVDDSAPVPLDRLELAQVSVYSLRGPELARKGQNFLFSVEALRPGTQLACRVGIAEGLLSEPSLRFGERRGWIEGLCQMGRERAAKAIAAEKLFYRECRQIPLIQFYERLERLASDLAENQFPLQMAWGSGWAAKTLGSPLSEGAMMEEVRGRYRLGRPGAPFPKSRRLIERGGAPSEPPGWVKVTL